MTDAEIRDLAKRAASGPGQKAWTPTPPPECVGETARAGVRRDSDGSGMGTSFRSGVAGE